MSAYLDTFLFLFVGLMMYVLHKSRAVIPLIDEDGVEVFRGDEPSARLAMTRLNDCGIAAWMECDHLGTVERAHARYSNALSDPSRLHRIHIEAAQLETAQAFMAGTIVIDA